MAPAGARPLPAGTWLTERREVLDRRTRVDRIYVASLHSRRPRSLGCMCLVAAAANLATRPRASEVDMLGEGEGLELLGVFFTFMIGLGVMVMLGKWWEA